MERCGVVQKVWALFGRMFHWQWVIERWTRVIGVRASCVRKGSFGRRVFGCGDVSGGNLGG